MSEVDFTWKIGGEAGWGIKSSGFIFSKTFVRSGYHVFSYDEYPSLVRGGHNCFQARVSSRKVYSQLRLVDILVALNKESFYLHSNELKEGAVVIYDGGEFSLNEGEFPSISFINIPLRKIAAEKGGKKVMMNNVALGASMAVLNFDLGILGDVISDQFSDKGEDVVLANIESAQGGYDYVNALERKALDKIVVRANPGEGRMLVTGNEAVAMGGLAGGLQFYPAYPMTPASSILHFLSRWGEQYGVAVVQVEDELSAVNMAIGAAFAGVRSMTATSGGGFCLMTEGLGLAGMTETPLVIVVSQRPGPATGLPTWTEQGDLRFVLHAHQGSFPRVVAAPGDVAEAFEVTRQCLDMAEKYQLPVIILLDKFLSESYESTDFFKFDQTKFHQVEKVKADKVRGDYQRYAFTSDGVSPRAFPGHPGIVVRANSDEHDPFGFSTEEIEVREKMMEKRFRKLESLKVDLPQPRLYGQDEAPITFVAWGTTKGAVLEAQRILLGEGISTNLVHFVYLNPFPSEVVGRRLEQCHTVICVEGNYDGLLAGLIREKTGFNIEHKFLKYDGRPFYPEEIVSKVRELIK
ncbi:hypothetical protein B5M47_03795 [candidate division CPR3 bacterium 4484_211]|uniref:2-oxoacid:ferredoxin oxidoreductase subunit alpha n=1 Tax=candidate division CPR3 bacterium 4484_211 TaxID=1968527 RepID=A0A1W9NWM8_UNCC3|nr:MAG: hypothetical protein B5M47_03795 [candidate division CPR3 bacterium 4484_211]